MVHKFLVVIGGPTAVGKTQVAIQLATHFNTEIINADSRQVYKELIIGVGRPSPEQLQQIKHHLIGHVSIFDAHSAGQFATDALDILHRLYIERDVAIVCGGTGLYIRSLIEGIDPFPDIPDSTTAKWTQVWKQDGLPALINALENLDPAYLMTVDKENPMRLIRALAVSDHSGRPYSSFRSGEQSKRDFEVIPILLELPRAELYAHINQRVIDMVHAGWMQEAASLYPHRSLKALQTVGYKELFDVMDGKLTLDEAITAIQQSTRHYAKRQMTWFRNQGEWRVFHPEHIPQIIENVSRLKSMDSMDS